MKRESTRATVRPVQRAVARRARSDHRAGAPPGGRGSLEIRLPGATACPVRAIMYGSGDLAARTRQGDPGTRCVPRRRSLTGAS